jgi:ParB-like chromosome segregation protein Spo0J
MSTLELGDVVWREDLYPRFAPDPTTIQRYAESIEHLPPIEVNQHNELIDGYHRWVAHQKAGAQKIAATVTETQSDAHLQELGIEKNAKHGLQLTRDEKRTIARKLYAAKQVTDKKRFQDLLGVGKSALSEWLQDLDRAEREERDRRIRDMWLACRTQDAIAEAVGLSQQQIAEKLKVLPKIPNLEKPVKLRALYEEEDWKPPHFDIWSFAAKTNETSHFGNTEQRIVDNLLYLYTEPFEVVYDPFGGGGSTIDLCKKRSRRYWVADRLPLPERPDVRQADIADGPPRLPWSETALVYLDPPYWKQAKGEYSTDPQDLANMELEDFYAALAGFVRACASKMRDGSRIALIIQPTMWRATDRKYTDHVFDLIGRIGNRRVQCEQRVSCPYSTEQYNAQMVNWAKEYKRLLVRNRELIIWRVAK